MKTLSSFVEIYKPKSKDEQKFVDKHIILKKGDRNGNGDEVFNGSKVKKIDRKKERHGYDTEEGESVYESSLDNTHELITHQDNQLYKSSYVPVAKNLEKKFKKGTYDPEKAKTLWKYHADRLAKSYVKQNGGSFKPAERRIAADHFAKEHEAEMKAGNFHESYHTSTIAAMAASRYEPKVGDKIRTKKGGQIPGTVTKVDGQNVHFKHPEGKTYKTFIDNVMREAVVVAKRKKVTQKPDWPGWDRMINDVATSSAAPEHKKAAIDALNKKRYKTEEAALNESPIYFVKHDEHPDHPHLGGKNQIFRVTKNVKSANVSKKHLKKLGFNNARIELAPISKASKKVMEEVATKTQEVEAVDEAKKNTGGFENTRPDRADKIAFDREQALHAKGKGGYQKLRDRMAKDLQGVFYRKHSATEEVETVDEGFKSAKMEINRLKTARAKNDAIAVAAARVKYGAKEKDTAKELPMRKEEAVDETFGGTKTKVYGEPPKGTIAYDRKYGKYTAKGELRKKPNLNKPPKAEDVTENHGDGYYVMSSKGQSVSYHKDKDEADKHASQLNFRGGSSYKVVADIKKKSVKEEYEQMDEGRPSQQHPLEGHEYHKKTDAQLEYIAKDAYKAAEAMKSHNTTAENKYRDQANDSATVRHFRKTSGMPAWYKKKYGHANESVVVEEEQIDEGNPNKRLVSTHGEGGHHGITTKVYYNPEYKEYSVHQFKDGKNQGEKHVSYHDDKEDAQDTAKSSAARMNINFNKEEVDLDETIKLKSKVVIRAPGKDYHDEVGTIGEIRHGQYKGAPKTYTVDYQGKSVQLGKENIKLHKEEVEIEYVISGIKSESNKNIVLKVFNSLTEENQAIFLEKCNEVGGVEAMLDFCIKNRGII